MGTRDDFKQTIEATEQQDFKKEINVKAATTVYFNCLIYKYFVYVVHLL